MNIVSLFFTICLVQTRENKNKLILMSLININKNTELNDEYNQYLYYNPELKDKYGEVNTPFTFINRMLSIIPTHVFENKNYKWLDVGAGHGNYSICLFFILYISLEKTIPNDIERKHHIIQHMIYMIEINPDNISYLREKFGNKSNIICENYLEWNPGIKFDIIIGNPPYNINGTKKVPTNSTLAKKSDGQTIWCNIVKKNITMLNDNGIMNVLIPSIWMKPDKAGMYELLLKYKIEKLHAFSASETNKIFGFNVQTPICYFLMTKSGNTGKVELYDSIKERYIDFTLTTDTPIPLCFVSIVNKFRYLSHKYGSLDVVKTNMPKRSIVLSDTKTAECSHVNVHTTTLNNAKEPVLQFKYSNEPLAFYNAPKIIMAHKMYGFPYIDTEGNYGISSRDNYIINNKSKIEMELITSFLSTPLILFLFETTRYRMRYLEKYVFEFIPDFSKIPEAVYMYNEQQCDIYSLIGMDDTERKFVDTYFNIQYKYFI